MIDFNKTPEEIASDLYNQYVKKFTSGLMYIDADGEVMLDAVECAIIAVELALQVCTNFSYDRTEFSDKGKLTKTLEILKSKL